LLGVNMDKHITRFCRMKSAFAPSFLLTELPHRRKRLLRSERCGRACIIVKRPGDVPPSQPLTCSPIVAKLRTGRPWPPPASSHPVYIGKRLAGLLYVACSVP